MHVAQLPQRTITPDNSAVSGGTERKTSDFFTATSMVKLAAQRPPPLELPPQALGRRTKSSTAVTLQRMAISPSGVRSLATAYQPYCNRQGSTFKGRQRSVAEWPTQRAYWHVLQRPE